MNRKGFSFQSNEGRYLLAGFAIAIIAAFAVALTAYYDMRRNYNSIDWITHTGTVIGTLDLARGDSCASLGALQSYCLRGDPKNLEMLAAQISDLQRHSALLHAITRDNAAQQLRLDHVDSTASQVTRLTLNAIRIASMQSREDAIKDPVFVDLSTALAELVAQFDPMSAAERTLLVARTARLQIGARRSAMVMGVGGSLIFGWLLLVGGYAGLTTSRLKKIAAESKQADERFRALLETAPDAMVLVGQDGRIVQINAQTEKLFGYTRAELLGNTVDMLVPARFRDQHPQNGGQPPADRVKVRAMGSGPELHGLCKDGSEFPIEISLSRIESSDGFLICRAIRDVTERKRAEKKVSDLHESERRHAVQVEAANKEHEAFSYSVSHDLRAPLRSIDGFSMALIEDYAGQLDADAKRFLDRIRAATQRMAQLIDDLLNLARVTRTEMRDEIVDLGAIAKAVLADLQSADPQRHVECVIGESVIGRGDSRLLRVVLENLLGNAWKFTMNKVLARIEVGIAQRDGAPVYFVRDDGPGFDMAYVGKLFGTFQRLHVATEFPGTGIGLASVRRIIHRHGGRTWAEGAVGKGATFSFTLSEYGGGHPGP
jgi:PAS domain S-box-containing protein